MAKKKCRDVKKSQLRDKPENENEENGDQRQEPAQAHERQLVSTDATTEALALVLRENPHGVLYEQDELTALTGNFDKYRRGAGADRRFYQSAWNCQPVEIDRIKVLKTGRAIDRVQLELPFVAIVGGIQPDMLNELSDDRGREDGFIHRFLFCYPDTPPQAYTELGVSDETRQGYQKLIDALLYQPISMGFGVPAVDFTPEGHERWLNFMATHNTEMNDPAFPDYLRGPWRKLVAYCARFALILQCSRYACGEVKKRSVDDTSVRGAVALVDYFKGHARKVYQRLRREPTAERTTALLEWIAGEGGNASVRDVLTAKVAGCKQKGDVMALFERLQRSRVGQIRTRTPDGGGRPTIYFQIEAEEDG
jgi:hypothetical protein